MVESAKSTRGAGNGPASVIIPDFFCSIFSPDARINPHYEKVRADSNDWVKA